MQKIRKKQFIKANKLEKGLAKNIDHKEGDMIKDLSEQMESSNYCFEWEI
jgi:hypothetical protein